jgi:hypothetical protein
MQVPHVSLTKLTTSPYKKKKVEKPIYSINDHDKIILQNGKTRKNLYIAHCDLYLINKLTIRKT